MARWSCVACTSTPICGGTELVGRCWNSQEQECRRRDRPRMDLSTAELQRDALAFYRNAGYVLVREEVGVAASNKTVGGGISRYHFSKAL